jgi:ParB-like chromosome segregation protein Spo0J
LETWGYIEPIVVNKRTKRILGGHQRYKVLKDKGITEVDAVVVDLSEDEEKVLMLALNKISAKWDYDKLAKVVKQIRTGGIDINKLGFDKNILAVLLEQDKIHTVISERREKFIEQASEGKINGRIGNYKFQIDNLVYKKFLKTLQNKPAHQVISDGIANYLKNDKSKN